MESNIYRIKLLNAILFFAKNVKFANMTKISKLLYFFDFTHFKQTGYPSIGLEYFAFRKGPVPKSFWLEIKDGKIPEDFKDKLSLILKKDEEYPNFKEIEFKARQDPDLSIFSQREKEILENLVFIFKDEKAGLISEISHLEKQPWSITIKEKGENEVIDYILAIDKDAEVDKEYAKESLKEHFEIMKNFSIKPTK